MLGVRVSDVDGELGEAFVSEKETVAEPAEAVTAEDAAMLLAIAVLEAMPLELVSALVTDRVAEAPLEGTVKETMTKGAGLPDESLTST